MQLSDRTVFAIALSVAAGGAAAQSDPGLFGNVYNIGTATPGSIFDIVDDDIRGVLTTGTQVGDGDFLEYEAFISPTFLGGDILGPSSQLNLFNGGEILRFFSAGPRDGFTGPTEVNVFGGAFGGAFNAGNLSTINIFSGASIGNGYNALSGSETNISGGNVGVFFEAFSGSRVNISGGTFGASFRAYSGSAVNISGGDFQVNGSASTDVSGGGLFTGVLEDGTVFIFEGGSFGGTTTLDTVSVAPSTNPGVLSSGAFSKGVRSGESLTVTESGRLTDNFAVVGGTLNIEGGIVGDTLEVAFSEVNISGGVVGNFLDAYSSTVNVSGGTVGFDLDANSGSTVNISAGFVDGVSANAGSTVNISGGVVESVGAFTNSTVNISGGVVGETSFLTDAGSTVNISGGMIQPGFSAGSDGIVNISGGVIGDDFQTFDSEINVSGGTFGDVFINFGTRFNLFGTEFFVDGVELTDLQLDRPFIIDQRGVTLSGILADGSAFEFDVTDNFFSSTDFFASSTIVTVTLVPAPTAAGVIALAGIAAAGRRRG
ncbi:MAG: hypothetical protein AAGI53_00415 [Planctomycetota bacterium]